MSLLKRLIFLFSFSGLTVRSTAQGVATAVTLWQFGQGRLLSASSTLPLIPLGTASDGSATTFLYQALNPKTITTTNAGVATTQAIPFPTPRTIIASASGWNEPGEGIACTLISSDFGDCVVAGTVANSGPPTAEVLAIAISTTPIPTTPVPTPSLTPTANLPPTSASGSASDVTLSPLATATSSPRSTSPVGAIVGGVIGGLALVIGFCVFWFVFLRRPQRRGQQPSAHPPPPPNMEVFNTAPALEAATERPRLGILPPRKGHVGRVQPFMQSPVTIQSPSTLHVQSPSSAQSPQFDMVSPVPSSNLEGQMVEISQRLKRLEARGTVYDEPLPSYGDS